MFHATIIYRGPLEGKVKGMSKVVKAAMTDGLLKWHQDILPLHFKPQGQVSARYPGVVKSREAKYMKRKGYKYRHQNLLEFSGELKRNVSRGISVSGTSKEIRGRLPGSQKANFKASAKSPDMRAELTTTNEAEAMVLAQIVDAKVGEFLQSNEGTKTVNP